MNKIIVAIDGYSGTGKSSTAKAVAKCLSYTYIDSGAMYRAVTYYFLQNGVDINSPHAVTSHLKRIELTFQNNGEHEMLLLNGAWVDNQLRTMEVNSNVSPVSAIPEVRTAMVKLQQEAGREKGVVMDGRDIGTVVFPDADLKVFMTASIDVRSKRRQLELKEKGIDSDIKEIKRNLAQRDKIDSSRETAPLIKAVGALEIDTSALTFEEQVQTIVEAAKHIIDEG
jgi:cytidylate kinase